jgi:5-methylcytosine-specific restriction endonuclease McrA
MALSSKQRQQVWAKSEGHCWYCGSRLPKRGWHADHVEPVLRESDYQQGKGFVQTGDMQAAHRDTIENMVPACAPCNLFKATFTVEEFRREISLQAERGRERSVNFRTAERFGLIEVRQMPVVFWYERHRASNA